MSLDASSVVGHRQPDQRSCGPSCLVAARMLIDPAFALSVQRLGWPAEVLATHRRVDGLIAADGGMQLPWPRVLGTPPWALARELSSYDGPRVVRQMRLDPVSVLPAVHAAVAADDPVPLYVGNAWWPRHVVLALGHAGDDLQVYEPARGVVVGVTDAQVSQARLSLAGWSTAWLAVLPRS